MKKAAIVSVITVLLTASYANAAYVIDGNVDDWGIDLNQAVSRHYLDKNLPSGGLDIDYVTEDNATLADGWIKVGPGWSVANGFDAEALYFDNDATNAYIALIQGMPENGALAGNRWLGGDIAIDADNDLLSGYKGYEFALVTREHGGLNAGSLYNVLEWNNVYYNQHKDSNPWNAKTVVSPGAVVEFFYNQNPVNGHYVIEASVPLEILGIDAAKTSDLRIHWTQQCGNDRLDLVGDVNPVPEPATGALFAFGCLLGLLKRRLNKL